ncbi:nucleoside triphosphate pyrophosphohydrolase HAM1 KNAG_0G00240 [Huiozyma naganishii CBS 8797]|uniref:Inosine triphosphate pyrophosphatase n=1 Tax=Huiozyma naganishii (strain ATCC MYA-139 / BCRC 22969 / CBS 8797 / KCTC 17520 / NBRC 10181 / NCYC 3082 / Yp74L-3) TaxID=1071383 RepID=J7S0P0_HUIN7|nr:hypothetical protein KNAG_0G00240 [Kazachstania naganishii CBS 8797]CCK71082.1 hypothetical protein KNAG_0G00240 [Kazachstania naganishii CBS 8797]
MVQDIVFVTGNANKLKEVQMLLSGSDINLSNEPLDLDELQDTDLQKIAVAKCQQAVQVLGAGKPVFVEDTALTFQEFNGLPGAYIKWFLKSMGLEKIVQMLDNFPNKSAQAITTIAYADSEGKIHVFEGITDGKIVPARGPTAFGWDPIFEPLESHGQTYAEMTKEDKNVISHRGRAFAKFNQFLSGN